jgi:hypothetical protein
MCRTTWHLLLHRSDVKNLRIKIPAKDGHKWRGLCNSLTSADKAQVHTTGAHTMISIISAIAKNSYMPRHKHGGLMFTLSLYERESRSGVLLLNARSIT